MNIYERILKIADGLDPRSAAAAELRDVATALALDPTPQGMAELRDSVARAALVVANVLAVHEGYVTCDTHRECEQAGRVSTTADKHAVQGLALLDVQRALARILVADAHLPLYVCAVCEWKGARPEVGGKRRPTAPCATSPCVRPARASCRGCTRDGRSRAVRGARDRGLLHERPRHHRNELAPQRALVPRAHVHVLLGRASSVAGTVERVLAERGISTPPKEG